jgi:hypothetical protein
MKYVKKYLTVVCFLCGMTILSANPAQQVKDALENTRNLHVEEVFAGIELSTISTASVYEASLGFDIPDTGGNISIRQYVLKDKDTLTKFNTKYQLFCSEEFRTSIIYDFHLKSIEDGLLFQKFLYTIDENYFNEGFFIEGNSWIFVRDEFFGDIEAWIVETDPDGTITAIAHELDADFEMADEMITNTDIGFFDPEEESSPVPEEVFQRIETIISKDFVYELEVFPRIDKYLEQVSKANWYDCTISIIEEYDDMTTTSYYDLLALENYGDVFFFEDTNSLISSSSFLICLQDDFFLIDETSQEVFEFALDQISDFDRREKARFERNGEWVFIRDEFFDDGRGFIVKTDEIGTITHIEYSWEIPLEGIEVPIEVVFDESSVTWTFTLVEPQKKDMQIPEPKDIPVTIEFNDWASNQIGAWIGTFQDDEIVGMYAGSDITSPFYETIPGVVLNDGENIISFRLLRPGNDYNESIAEIDISIWLGD